MDRRGFDIFLAGRGQRAIHLPSPALAVAGSDDMSPLAMQSFPRGGLTPKPRPIITPEKFQSGALIGDTIRQTLQELDTIRPKKGKC